ncbi:caspase-1-like isoform X1 [Carassius auratus]|uniref:Caspase-1-like isoform X1 n=1 Tax=Carassius auratus TaxID=7957 RepID=A0A6P6PQD4_CARAU|nr:caspase-1-like isoform X1 [Carassius auratus]
MTEDHDWDEDLEEADAAIARVFQHLNVHKQHTDESGRNSEVRPSNERVDFVALPCGHRMPTDYVVAWFKYYLKQKKTAFSCPRKSCSVNLSYQDICQLIPLTDKQREFLEENLALLVARRLFDFKACPGCQSNVERRDRGNLCVNCTICTANLKRNYYFCWNCRREWKGPTNNAVRCENNNCGQRVRTSDPLTPCTPEFKKKMLQEMGDDIYPVKDKSTDRKRLALLINNVEFRNLNDRAGADKDEVNMEVLLKALGYTVITLRDLSAQGMHAALRDFAQREEHAKSDSCFVVLMSHGDARGICGVFDSFDNEDEEDVLQADEIFNSLNTPNCAGLLDKPKIILIQACRGEPHPFQAPIFAKCPHIIDEEGSVYVQDAVPTRKRAKEHREKDFCCLRSCTPDTVSYRNQERGSHFIQNIVEIFNQDAHQDDIEELFRKVIKKFKMLHPCQMPCKERATLSKRFYLFPGL